MGRARPEARPDESLDLRGVPCPANTARLLLRLDGLDPGQVLEVVLDAGEPFSNAIRESEEEGHRVLKRETTDGAGRLLIRRSKD